MPVLTGSVHADILTKPSRAGFAVSRLELIEPGAATCARRDNVCQARQRVFRGMAGPCLKSLERMYEVQVPVNRFFYHHTSCHISHQVRPIMNTMWLISYHIPGSSIPPFALPIYKTTCDAKPYLYRSVQYRYLSTSS